MTKIVEALVLVFGLKPNAAFLFPRCPLLYSRYYHYNSRMAAKVILYGIDGGTEAVMSPLLCAASLSEPSAFLASLYTA